MVVYQGISKQVDFGGISLPPPYTLSCLVYLKGLTLGDSTTLTYSLLWFQRVGSFSKEGLSALALSTTGTPFWMKHIALVSLFFQPGFARGRMATFVCLGVGLWCLNTVLLGVLFWFVGFWFFSCFLEFGLCSHQ